MPWPLHDLLMVCNTSCSNVTWYLSYFWQSFLKIDISQGCRISVFQTALRTVIPHLIQHHRSASSPVTVLSRQKKTPNQSQIHIILILITYKTKTYIWESDIQILAPQELLII